MTYDVTRLTPGGVETFHHSDGIKTDGPFLVLTAGGGPVSIIPAHALVSIDACGEITSCRVRS